MRSFRRTDAPEGYAEKAAEWTQNLEKKIDEGTTPSKVFRWPQWHNRSVREILVEHLSALTQKHCSFCDAFPLEGQSTEPIEHFQPKDTFWKLAFAWENLYYCCELCNTCKSNQWDEDLLAPDRDGYSCQDYFEFDYTTGAVRPNSRADHRASQRAEVTIRLFQLDTDKRRSRRRLEARKWERLPKHEREEVGAIHDYGHRDYLEALA
jgi:uncharacterized protein (TIGR02646 family)